MTPGKRGGGGKKDQTKYKNVSQGFFNILQKKERTNRSKKFCLKRAKEKVDFIHQSLADSLKKKLVKVSPEDEIICYTYYLPHLPPVIELPPLLNVREERRGEANQCWQRGRETIMFFLAG